VTPADARSAKEDGLETIAWVVNIC